MRLAEFNPQNLANTACTFAALGVQEEDRLGEGRGVQPAELGEHGVAARSSSWRRAARVGGTQLKMAADSLWWRHAAPVGGVQLALVPRSSRWLRAVCGGSTQLQLAACRMR